MTFDTDRPLGIDDDATCTRCDTDLNGSYMTYYGEALCDPCFDGIEGAPKDERR